MHVVISRGDDQSVVPNKIVGILPSLENAAMELCSYAAILLWLKEVELKRTISIS